MKPLLTTLFSVLLGYGLVVAGIYMFQEKLLFHPQVAADYEPVKFPKNIEKFYITTPSGLKLQGVRSKVTPADSPILLSFGGNAHNLTNFTSYMAALMPKVETMAINYRGFGESEGKPQAAEILADADFIYKWVTETYPSRDLYVMGVSLGTGPATKLSQYDKVKGVMLAMPYDDMTDLAASKYPWIPVSLLFRNPIPSIEWARNAKAPVAIVVAGDDQLIPNERSERMRDAFPQVVDYHTLSGVGHVALLDDPRLDTWIPEALEKLKATHQK